MKNFLRQTGKLSFGFLGIGFFVSMVCGCGAGATENQSSEALKEEASSEETAYYVYYHGTFEDAFVEELEVDGETIPIAISTNVRRCTDHKIKIDGQEMPNDQESEIALIGYYHALAEAHDFTGDGKEEIVLSASGGTGGHAIRIFGRTDGQWQEIELPSAVSKSLDNPPEFVQEKLDELNKEMSPSSVVDRGHRFSWEDGKVFVRYPFVAYTDSAIVDVGALQKELVYSSDEKKFVFGDALFIPEEN